ncbi:hypothetical protein GCM10009670_14470 [Citricoccus alkalitolerans]
MSSAPAPVAFSFQRKVTQSRAWPSAGLSLWIQSVDSNRVDDMNLHDPPVEFEATYWPWWDADRYVDEQLRSEPVPHRRPSAQAGRPSQSHVERDDNSDRQPRPGRSDSHG